MITVGIDIAASTGLCALDGDDLRCAKQLVFEEINDPYKRGIRIAHGILNNLPGDYELVVIEGFIIGHPSSAIRVVELGTIVRYNLWKEGLKWVEVAPSALKKWTTGKGSFKKGTAKARMSDAVFTRWGETFKCNDVTDAYALARMGQDPGLLDIIGVTQRE